jgi:hypothetical protein
MTFERFEDIQHRWSDLRKEMALRCELVKLVYVWRGRNTWSGWGTWYYKRSSFCADLTSARHVAERNRVQGTRWYLRELPACLLTGQRYSLLLTEINTDYPLLGRHGKGLQDFSLYSIAQTFAPRKKHSVVRLVFDSPPGAADRLRPTALQPYDGNLRRYTSVSRGGKDVPLDWTTEDRYHFKTLSLEDMVSAFNGFIPKGLAAGR